MRIILNESQYKMFLMEDRIPFLKKKWVDGEKITAAMFNAIVEADPSKTKEYVDWLSQIYVDGNLKSEDLYKATEYLELYSKVRNKLNGDEKNIYAFDTKNESYVDTYDGKTKTRKVKKLKIDSLQTLYKLIRPFEKKAVSNKEKADEIKKQARKVYEDDNWLVVIPETKEAACFYGAGTQWCTAAKQNNYFDYYNEQGDLFININKKTKEKYQFHFEENQFMDETDSPVSLHYFRREIGLMDFYEKAMGDIYRTKFEIKEDSEGCYITDNSLDLKDFLEIAYGSDSNIVDYIAKVYGGEDEYLEPDYHYDLEKIFDANDISLINKKKMREMLVKQEIYDEELKQEENFINNEGEFEYIKDIYNEMYYDSFSSVWYKEFVYDALERIGISKPQWDTVTMPNGETKEYRKFYLQKCPTIVDLAGYDSATEYLESEVNGKYYPSDVYGSVDTKEFNERIGKYLDGELAKLN